MADECGSPPNSRTDSEEGKKENTTNIGGDYESFSRSSEEGNRPFPGSTRHTAAYAQYLAQRAWEIELLAAFHRREISDRVRQAEEMAALEMKRRKEERGKENVEISSSHSPGDSATKFELRTQMLTQLTLSDANNNE